MALAPLATVADLTARGLVINEGEEPIVGVFLEVASAAVRDAAGSPIVSTTSTVILEGDTGTRLRLPGQPITAVSEVVLNGDPVTDWRLTSGVLWRARGWSPGCEPSDVEVTQTHGLPSVPADIVDLVCRMVAAALVAYRSEDGGTGLAAQDVRAERIGDYSVTYGDNQQITEMQLPTYLRDRLVVRFGGGAYVVKTR